LRNHCIYKHSEWQPQKVIRQPASPIYSVWSRCGDHRTGSILHYLHQVDQHVPMNIFSNSTCIQSILMFYSFLSAIWAIGTNYQALMLTTVPRRPFPLSLRPYKERGSMHPVSLPFRIHWPVHLIQELYMRYTLAKRAASCFLHKTLHLSIRSRYISSITKSSSSMSSPERDFKVGTR